jgi:phage terminase small subunit
MAVLKNPRHELFAQHLAKGKTATDAYAAAGYRPNQPNSARLISNDMVRARLAELQDRAAIRTEVTVASLLAEAEDARVAAMEAGQFSAAISAIREKGVLAGLRVEKRENTAKRAEDMTDDELLAIAAGGRVRASDPPQGSNPGKFH